MPDPSPRIAEWHTDATCSHHLLYGFQLHQVQCASPEGGHKAPFSTAGASRDRELMHPYTGSHKATLWAEEVSRKGEEV